jgi:hypothetical protein
MSTEREGDFSKKKRKKKEYDHPQRKRKDCPEAAAAAVMSPAGSRSLIQTAHNLYIKTLHPDRRIDLHRRVFLYRSLNSSDSVLPGSVKCNL